MLANAARKELKAREDHADDYHTCKISSMCECYSIYNMISVFSIAYGEDYSQSNAKYFFIVWRR